MKTQQFVSHLLADPGIEAAERVVEDQHVGLRRQRAGDRDPLPLGGRQFVGVTRREAVDTQGVERFRRPFATLRAGQLGDARRVANVFSDRHPGKQGVVLKDQTHAAFRRGHRVHDFRVKENFAVVQRFQARDEPGKRRFAGSRRPEDDAERPAGSSSDAPSTTATRS